MCKFTSKKQPDVVCYHCGRPGHYVSKCRVSRGVTCHQCGKTGHLQRACQSGKQSHKKEKTQSQPRSIRRVEQELDLLIFQVGAQNKTPPYKVTVQVDSCDVVMELDMGIISFSNFEDYI